MTGEGEKKPIMRCLGEFFGNIAKGVRTKPGEENTKRIEIDRKVEERTEGDVTLRRTTIDEVEIHGNDEDEDGS